MDQVIQIVETAVRVVLATAFFVTPGILLWLTVIGVAAAIRRLGSTSRESEDVGEGVAPHLA